MVRLHVKRSDTQEFLVDTTVEAEVSEVIKQVVELNNLKHKIERLRLEGGELAKYGPALSSEDQEELEEEEEKVSSQSGQEVTIDPTGRRSGDACSKELQEQLLKALDEAAAAGSQEQVAKKVALTHEGLLRAIDTVRGAVMSAYPQGLPPWDRVRQALEGTEQLAGTSRENDDLDPRTTELWFAGKQMLPGNKLSAHAGNQERSKLIVRVQKAGQSAPQREPAVDVATQQAMLSWYRKKQDEQERLAGEEADDYAHSRWADPQSLKTYFSGGYVEAIATKRDVQLEHLRVSARKHSDQITTLQICTHQSAQAGGPAKLAR
ncbi:hypothetical protein WJX74_002381 [Apatococcus lobatus]|uniref:Ubiquitin-like domain-containing protein n=1 Tax=Apatococcus lobatus TaxID=904363 RepID=A0AAW1RGL1_9CHLO